MDDLDEPDNAHHDEGGCGMQQEYEFGHGMGLRPDYTFRIQPSPPSAPKTVLQSFS